LIDLPVRGAAGVESIELSLDAGGILGVELSRFGISL